MERVAGKNCRRGRVRQERKKERKERGSALFPVCRWICAGCQFHESVSPFSQNEEYGSIFDKNGRQGTGQKKEKKG